MKYHINPATWSQLVSNAEDYTPITETAEGQAIIAIKTSNQKRNLWRIDLNTNQHKQLTFGELGAVNTWHNAVVFQYAHQTGLWQLNIQGQNHGLISNILPANSQILSASKEYLYFVTGGPCHESDIYQLNLRDNSLNTYLKRTSKAVRSLGISQGGVIQMPCTPPTRKHYELKINRAAPL